MRFLAAGAALLVAVALAACGPEEGGAESDAPLTVYLNVPLSGARAAEGRQIEAAARASLASADGRAGEHPIELVVLDDAAGGTRSSPVATGANARRASEDADAIAYIGDLEPEAMLTSAPITDLAGIPQLALSDPPEGLDVENLVIPPKPGDGAAAIELVLGAVAAAGDEAVDRTVVRDELRDLAAGSSR